jgi:hypothetical protein
VRISYRLRGMEQVLRAVEDIKRGIDLGGRGFLIYDEGLLWLVNQMRKDGELPGDIVFKSSAHLGHCNPASFKVLESLGADSINPVRDLQLPMMAALRAAVKVPLTFTRTTPLRRVDSSASTKRPRLCGWLRQCISRQATRWWLGMGRSPALRTERAWPGRLQSLWKW